MIGFIAMADRLRELQEELGRGLEIERDRARREEELAGLDRRRRDQERERIGRLIDGEGLGVALQPIVDLDSRQVIGAEALARFKARTASGCRPRRRSSTLIRSGSASSSSWR